MASSSTSGNENATDEEFEAQNRVQDDSLFWDERTRKKYEKQLRLVSYEARFQEYMITLKKKIETLRLHPDLTEEQSSELSRCEYILKNLTAHSITDLTEHPCQCEFLTEQNKVVKKIFAFVEDSENTIEKDDPVKEKERLDKCQAILKDCKQWTIMLGILLAKPREDWSPEAEASEAEKQLIALQQPMTDCCQKFYNVVYDYIKDRRAEIEESITPTNNE